VSPVERAIRHDLMAEGTTKPDHPRCNAHFFSKFPPNSGVV
jgi:hypothetical protein